MRDMDEATRELSIFRIGRVISVNGREVSVRVDKRKNSSHLIYKGKLLKNVSVGGYLKIMKGFTAIVAKVEGEYTKEEKDTGQHYQRNDENINRALNLKLMGFIDNGKFYRGIKELPLIDNEVYLLNNDEFNWIHSFVEQDDIAIHMGALASDDNQPIHIGINSLFASHIGIFGNTGSGKSYSLAKIYYELFQKFGTNPDFQKNAKFLMFDFNGEYSKRETITSNKKVYKLSTRGVEQDKLPFLSKDLLNLNLLSILASATEKTQQPFLGRVIRFYNNVHSKTDTEALEHFKNIIRKYLVECLSMADRVKAFLILDYFKQILKSCTAENEDLLDDISWHGTLTTFYFKNSKKYFNSNGNFAKETKIYNVVKNLTFQSNVIEELIKFAYMQLIMDVLANRALNEHIAPAINKLKGVQVDLNKILNVSSDDFWGDSNIVIVDLNESNIQMKKLIPLLLSFKLYSEHKEVSERGTSSLNIIIDEAHNILSYASNRESEDWKDYRLETFEEIIKEGRKFGVFLTIASQRPSDISPTIISQLHNYFIHRLINQKDLEMVEKTISYLDKVSAEQLPILPTGACVLAGMLVQLPVIVQMGEINKEYQPNSQTMNLIQQWGSHE